MHGGTSAAVGVLCLVGTGRVIGGGGLLPVHWDSVTGKG